MTARDRHVEDVPVKTYRRLMPEVSIAVETRGLGSVDVVGALERGDGDVGFAFADVVYLSFAGQIEGQGAALERLQEVAVLQTQAVYLLASPRSSLRSINELRGRRIGVGLEGQDQTSRLILRSFGIGSDDVTLVPLATSERFAQLSSGAIDATFTIAGYPAESIAAAESEGARLLPLEGPSVADLRKRYPFLRRVSIPEGMYRAGAFDTIGLDRLLICRSDLDDSLVHAVTGGFVSALPELAEEPAFRSLDFERAPATPIPLHPGAAVFYRERELTR